MFSNTISLEKYRPTIMFIIKSILGSLILAISAQVTIPLPLVPITIQTLALTIISLSLGSKAATSAVSLYLLEGIMGIPVFAYASSGINILVGIRGGYLIGMIPAAFFMGYFADQNYLKSFIKTAAVSILGTVIVMMFGLLQLSMFVPREYILAVGFYPFILIDIVKVTIASLLYSIALRFFNRI
ncbi:MAG: biotin transporter BioY [Brevinema sp.]